MKPTRGHPYPLVEQLLRRRARLGMSQVELATRTGRASPRLSVIERGQVDPRLSTLMAMAEALGVDLVAVPRSLRHHIDALIAGDEQGHGRSGYPMAPLGSPPMPPEGWTAREGRATSAFDDVFIPDDATLDEDEMPAGRSRRRTRKP